jgi:hypothetical protein
MFQGILVWFPGDVSTERIYLIAINILLSALTYRNTITYFLHAYSPQQTKMENVTIPI